MSVGVAIGLTMRDQGGGHGEPEAVEEGKPAAGGRAGFLPPTDPNNEPVKSINGAFLGVMGSVVTLTATTNRIAWDPHGQPVPDTIIAARLRFDLEVARAIRDQLEVQIALLSKPQGQAN